MTDKTVWTKEAIKARLLGSDLWLCRGILAIHARQTADEQACGATVEDNGVGFNGVDAEILSSFAKQYKERGFLSKRQIEIARKKMVKYSGQLANIANGG